MQLGILATNRRRVARGSTVKETSLMSGMLLMHPATSRICDVMRGKGPDSWCK